MPHIIVKLWPGKSEAQKTQLAAAITKDVMNVLNYGESRCRVSDGGNRTRRLAEKVYKPDVVNNSQKLYKKPGYTM